MYLSKIKLWNFRKFGSVNALIIDGDLRSPDLDVNFHSGLNVLVGENDSGKTAIIDAIKHVLKTHSYDWIRLTQDDFYKDSTVIRIECRFDNLAPNEAKNFTEWLGVDGEGEEAKVYLKIILEARKNNDRILPFDIKAGADNDGYSLTAEAREYLKTTYLKPLRDAKGELVPKKNSRLSQIFQGHEVFKDKNNSHDLVVNVYHKFCNKVENYFITGGGKEIKISLDVFLKDFFGENMDSKITITDQKLRDILDTLRLTLEDGRLGLGSHNLLFIASELLNLKRSNWNGVRLGLIEELEAHLHPQAQMRIIESLQKEDNIQFILTTHSPNLASKVKLQNLIMCADDNNKNINIFPLGNNYTKLEELDYKFLERFLDVTKSNLFFAKGVILVEGWTEEILLPIFAKIIGINLVEKGISIINVGSTAFLRYSRIFQRISEPFMDIPVSIVTDIDIKPENEESDFQSKIIEKENKYSGQKVKSFVSPHWTLEYCLGLSPTMAPYLFKATKNALIEMRSENTNSYAEITESYEDISNEEDQAGIALKIYQDFILAKNISKTIIAQQLAQILEESSEVSIDENEEHLKYLVDAIKYAADAN